MVVFKPKNSQVLPHPNSTPMMTTSVMELNSIHTAWIYQQLIVLQPVVFSDSGGRQVSPPPGTPYKLLDEWFVVKHPFDVL